MRKLIIEHRADLSALICVHIRVTFQVLERNLGDNVPLPVLKDPLPLCDSRYCALDLRVKFQALVPKSALLCDLVCVLSEYGTAKALDVLIANRVYQFGKSLAAPCAA